MRFKSLNNKPVFKNIEKFRIDWTKKSKSKIQLRTKEFLEKYWSKHICYEEMTLAGTRLSLDLVNLTRRIAIEVQGEQHSEYVAHFHRNKLGFLDQCDRDMKKKKWCELNDFKLVEIYKDDLPLSEEFFKDKYDIDLT